MKPYSKSTVEHSHERLTLTNLQQNSVKIALLQECSHVNSLHLEEFSETQLWRVFSLIRDKSRYVKCFIKKFFWKFVRKHLYQDLLFNKVTGWGVSGVGT